jgi:DNA adenine methylase
MPGAEPKTTVTPPLKWAGGKRWQVPRLLSLWKSHANRRLVEPFAGGLAVTLGLMPDKALLNDTNDHLVNFYRWLQSGLKVEIPLENSEKLFYRHRARFNALIATGQDETTEAAALFYYLNRTGFNGLCRFNASGEFNVPFGKYKKIIYRRDFTAYRAVLAAWTFSQGDFEDIVLRPTDFVYADPPYDVEFTKYSKGGFSWDDQVRAAEWLAKHKGPVVLVNQSTPRIEQLYRRLKFDVRFLDAPRRISCNGDRTPAREILGTRNL